MNYIIAKTLFVETRYSKLYIKLCDSYTNNKFEKGMHKHHFLPKCTYSEYSNLQVHTWNCILVNARQHYILHLLLYKHYKKIGNTLDAISHLRAMKNFSSNSRNYEIFRKNHSNLMRKWWKENKENVGKKISNSLLEYYNTEDGKQKRAEAGNKLQKQWQNMSYEDRLHRQEKISIATKESMQNLNMGDIIEDWKVSNPDQYKQYINNMKTTINSQDYKEKFPTCEHCNKKHSFSNHAQYHGDKCSKNKNRSITLITCECCTNPYQKFTLHLSRSQKCKEYYDNKRRSL